MDYRKVISFGKSSFVISLPKTWIKQNNIKKGQLVYVNVKENDLLVSAKEEKDQIYTSITINVDGKNIGLITRELNAAYIENNREIILEGKELKEKSKELLEITRQLIALEVLELDSQRIVTKDFLDMDKISIIDLMKKIDMIVRSMLKDCINSFDEENAENINLRDKDVNRLSFLLFRIIRYGLSNQANMFKTQNFRAIDLLNEYWTTFHLEAIADEIKRVSRGMARVSISKSKQKEFKKIISDVEEFYTQVIKAHYSKTRPKALALSEYKKPLVDRINTFYDENFDSPHISYMIDRFRRMIGSIHELNRLTFQH
jgi:phosphate uptake regulator